MEQTQTLELWILLQVALEAVLVVLMAVFLVRVRRLGRKGPEMPRDVQAAMERFLTQSEKLSKSFNQTLEQKKELSLNLLLKLERKINEMQRLLNQAEKGLTQAQKSQDLAGDFEKANPAAPENRALVVRLAGQGMTIEEIARKAHLHRGEVELILDLEKEFRN